MASSVLILCGYFIICYFSQSFQMGVKVLPEEVKFSVNGTCAK